MTGSITLLAKLVVTGALVALALTAGAASARASTSCGIVPAGGHPWIVVAKGVPCSKAKAVTRAFAVRTAALRSGQRRVVTTSLLHGFTCVISSHGKPGGSCSTPGAVKSILWIVAA